MPKTFTTILGVVGLSLALLSGSARGETGGWYTKLPMSQAECATFLRWLAGETPVEPANKEAPRSPLLSPPIPPSVFWGTDLYGFHSLWKQRFLDELRQHYIVLNEEIYYPMGWPRWVPEFPREQRRAKDDLYYVHQKRHALGNHHHYQKFRALSSEKTNRREIEKHIRFVFDVYRKHHTVSEEEIQSYLAMERSLSLHRTSYFVYTNSETGGTEAVVRLFDGSRTPVAYAGYRGDVETEAGDARLPIERLFPHLELPERKRGENVYELGRLAKGNDVIDPIMPLCRAVTDHLYYKRGSDGEPEPGGTIYVAALPAQAELYTKEYGFEVAYTPRQLKIEKRDPQIHVLKISVNAFMKHFTTSPMRVPVIPRPAREEREW